MFGYSRSGGRDHDLSRKNNAVRELAKAASYISGFDAILYGGLPEGRTTLIEGSPGSGKSVVALEFLYRGALVDEPGIFVTFEERADAVRRNAGTLGWDLKKLEKKNKLAIIEARMDPETVVSGDFNLKALLAIIEGQSKAISAKRIAFDALDVLIRLFDNPSRERSEMYFLNEWLLDHQMTAILTVGEGFGRQQYLRTVRIFGVHGRLCHPTHATPRRMGIDSGASGPQVPWLRFRPECLPLCHSTRRHQCHSHLRVWSPASGHGSSCIER